VRRFRAAYLLSFSRTGKAGSFAGEPFWPNGIYVDLSEYYESLDRLKALKGVILPGHDLHVTKKKRYP